MIVLPHRRILYIKRARTKERDEARWLASQALAKDFEKNY